MVKINMVYFGEKKKSPTLDTVPSIDLYRIESHCPLVIVTLLNHLGSHDSTHGSQNVGWIFI